MNNFKLLYFLLVAFGITACQKDEVLPEMTMPQLEQPTFTVNEDYFLKNDVLFPIKGVVYVPGYPGYLPWEIETSTSLPQQLRTSIDADMASIKAMGANTIRFWGAPKYCYEALKNQGGLYFIQTIWIDGEVPDFQNEDFKEISKSYIREVMDRIYSAFDDSAPPMIAVIVGNELSEPSIKTTDAAHPEIDHYTGNYIKTDSNLTATAAFIAEMADYTKKYALKVFGRVPLVSYANDIRTTDILETPFLDFQCQNAYSYAVPYYRPQTPPGSSSGTLFQGWIEKVKSKYPNNPLLISETGLSVSPNAPHTGPPNYGYGGNTETEQADGLLQNLSDINTSVLPMAGVCIHEYLDSWWKYGLEDSHSHDPNDIEEWFGIVRLKKSGDWYETTFRKSYYAIRKQWK